MEGFRKVSIGLFCFCLLGLTRCAGAPHPAHMADQCHFGLNSAFHELEQAKTNGFGGTVNWTKAATLLSTAKIQEQFEKFPNCIEKVNRARFYIKESQKT